MKKSLLFGGAFNPITSAHLFLSNYAREKLGYDDVLFMPSKSHYILSTEGKDFSFSDEERLEMLQEVSKDYPWMKVLDMELKMKEQPRTYFTLCKLKEEGYHPSLLMGSDWLPLLESKWLYVDKIASEFGIVILSRNGTDMNEKIKESPYLTNLRPYLTLLEAPKEFQHVSSSEVRRLFKEGRKNQEEIRRLIPVRLDGLEKFYQKGEHHEK